MSLFILLIYLTLQVSLPVPSLTLTQGSNARKGVRIFCTAVYCIWAEK